MVAWLIVGLGSGLASAPGVVRVPFAGAITSIQVPDLDGTLVTPVASDGRKATVLFFVMHECPVANGYAPEINRIRSEYGDRGVRSFVVYIEDDLAPEKARAHAREYGFSGGTNGLTVGTNGFTVGTVRDPSHLLVKVAGVTVSPEAAVLSASGELLYRGRIDDRVAAFGQRRVQPTRRDLRLALDAIVAGKSIPTRRTKAVGCYIPEITQPRPDVRRK